MKPIIGLTAAVDDEQTASVMLPYVRVIEMLGGLPILLPYVEQEKTVAEFVALCNGFFFTGGADVAPSYYGEEKKETCGTVYPDRDRLEMKMWQAVYQTGKPIIGICRGAQLINIALGGTLYQDLPTERPSALFHRQQEGKFEFSHDIAVLPNTPLSALTEQTRIRGNSFHHQAVKRLGEGLVPMALAEDGLIEGAYGVAHPYLRLYQWHPERLFDKDPHAAAIFTDFLAACRH